MGMFDDVRCKVPLPDGYTGRDFQTKDFECEMDRYTIRENGELWRQGTPWYADLTKEPTRVDFHGVLNFYDYDDEGLAPLAPHDESRWHEYDAKFTDGLLVEITGRTPRAGTALTPGSPGVVQKGERT